MWQGILLAKLQISYISLAEVILCSSYEDGSRLLYLICYPIWTRLDCHGRRFSWTWISSYATLYERTSQWCVGSVLGVC